MADEWKEDSGRTRPADDKTWALIEKTMLASVREQRRARRWGIFFKLLTFAYLIVMLVLFTPCCPWARRAG